MNILLIAHYTELPGIPGNNRFKYLAELLAKQHTVEVITTDFDHNTKKMRDPRLAVSNDYRVVMCHELPYKKNIGVKRILGNITLGRNIRKALSVNARPDIVYCAIPSLEVAEAAVDYCEKKNIPLIIDIQDLWPEAFKIAFNVPLLSDLLFLPMKKKANRIYAAADEIVAVSKTYLSRGLQVSNNVKGKVVYLGTEKDQFDAGANRNSPTNTELEKIINTADDNILMAYVGTLGSSYDLPLAIEAIKCLQDEGVKIRFVIMGDGPRRKELEKQAIGLNITFTGTLVYDDMVWLLKRCDIAINPIVQGAAQSIINKHMDYAMAGLPVINTQECEEYRELINTWNCGINCDCGVVSSVIQALKRLINDGRLRQEMAENSRKMGETLFDRTSTYLEIQRIIEENELHEKNVSSEHEPIKVIQKMDQDKVINSK